MRKNWNSMSILNARMKWSEVGASMLYPKKEIGGENLLGIRPYEHRSVLNNWTAEEIPIVFRTISE